MKKKTVPIYASGMKEKGKRLAKGDELGKCKTNFEAALCRIILNRIVVTLYKYFLYHLSPKQ